MGQWQSWAEFWSMDGKGFYVWWSFGLTFGMLVLELVLLRLRGCGTLSRLLRWRRATQLEDPTPHVPNRKESPDEGTP